MANLNVNITRHNVNSVCSSSTSYHDAAWTTREIFLYSVAPVLLDCIDFLYYKVSFDAHIRYYVLSAMSAGRLRVLPLGI